MVLNVGWQRSREKDSIFEGFGLGGTEGGSEGSCAYCGVVFGGKGGKAERIWFRGGFLRYFELAKEYLKRPPQTNRWRDEGLIQLRLWGLWFRVYFGVCRACDGIHQNRS